MAELRRFQAHAVVWRKGGKLIQLADVEASAADRLPSPEATAVGPVLAMSALGRLGRFGNQIFQYAFLRITANASSASVQSAPWAGQSLFGHFDPAVSVALTPRVETGQNADALLDLVPEFIPFVEKISGKSAGRIGEDAMTTGTESGDLLGFFQWHTSAYLPHKDFFRSLFKPVSEVETWSNEIISALRRNGKTVVAIHLRAGDYKWIPQFAWTLMVPPEWWVEWLESIWDTLEDPVLYLCSDDVEAVRQKFSRFNPVTAGDLAVSIPERLRNSNVGFYPDFFLMTQADVLGISNSTFSFSAAMLNERAQLFVRPHWDFETRFTTFHPWNADPLLRLPGERRPILKNYRDMLRVARETKGIRAALMDVFVHHPASTAALWKYRLGFAYAARGAAGVRDFALGRR